jgi:hypothetical protein
MLKTNLRDPSGEGGCTCSAHHLHPWRLPVVRAGDTRTIPFSWLSVAKEPIASTMISPELTSWPARPGLLMVAPCTLSLPGHWAGPVTCEIE